MAQWSVECLSYLSKVQKKPISYHQSANFKKSNSKKQLESKKASLKDRRSEKTPQHLGLLFHSLTHVSTDNLISLISLLKEAFLAEIQCISIYDRQGLIKQNLDELKDLFLEEFEDDIDSPLVQIYTDGKLQDEWSLQSPESPLGLLKLQFLSYEDDSKPRIAKVLCQKWISDLDDCNSTSTRNFFYERDWESSFLNLCSEFPAQDFIIVFGVSWNDLSLDGYSPLRLTSTEIL